MIGLDSPRQSVKSTSDSLVAMGRDDRKPVEASSRSISTNNQGPHDPVLIYGDEYGSRPMAMKNVSFLDIIRQRRPGPKLGPRHSGWWEFPSFSMLECHHHRHCMGELRASGANGSAGPHCDAAS